MRQKWADDLNPNTAKNYVYYFLGYVDWFKSKGHWPSAEAMLKEYAKLDQKEQFKHVDILKEHIKSKRTGNNDKRLTWHAVRSFYEFHRLSLPKLPRNEASRIFKPSEADKRRALELAPLKLEEVRELVLNMPLSYRAALVVIFQGAMSLAEFTQFNKKAWHRLEQDLEKSGPIRVDIYRSKTSRGNVKKYYTFIGEDAKTLIKQWLQARPKEDLEELFLTYNKNSKTWVPMTAPRIGSAVTKAAKRTGLIRESGIGRYHIHAHELRDLFKSLCTLNGVNQVASEFFLGHVVDKLGYDKSPEYDDEWFRNEYRKVEPLLNVISNTKGFKGEEDLKLVFKKELLLMAGYSKDDVEAMNMAGMSDEDLRTKVREKLLGMMTNNGSKQKLVTIDDVDGYLAQGWEFVAALPNSKAVMRIPS